MSIKDFHPISLIIYLLSVILFTMLTKNPVFIFLSFVGSIMSYRLVSGKWDIKFYIILFLIITITNPLFSQNGETVLLHILGRRITLESLFYGFSSAMMIVGIIYWFKVFSEVFKEDKLVWLIGKIAPKLCVVFCMAMRFIPLFKEYAKNIYEAQCGLGLFNTERLSGKLLLIKNVLSALISMSVENAIETADTMKSRGFENKKRSSYSLVRMRKTDLIYIVVTLIADCVLIYLLLTETVDFVYYPIIQLDVNLFFYAEGLCFILLFSLLIVYQLWRDVKWKYLISKI